MIMHFGLVVVENMASVSDKHKLFYIARAYGSFFHQSWNLFVPPPATNYKLYATFENNGLQKKELFGDMLARHQSNRLKGYGPLVITLSNSIFYFEKNTAPQSTFNGPIKNDLNFNIIEQAAKGYLNHKYNIRLQKPKLILVAEDLRSKKQRIYFNYFPL